MNVPINLQKTPIALRLLRLQTKNEKEKSPQVHYSRKTVLNQNSKNELQNIYHKILTASRACSRSRIRSSTFSIPIERRTRESVMPSFALWSAGTDAWVITDLCGVWKWKLDRKWEFMNQLKCFGLCKLYRNADR